ncbi:carbohydrate deacetylase [Rariglobus hedericola]|uniref:ChbG/HpnK family deacetylase n=1 Tax=Rariglobus hedericola TaxID=2597822 RepID=A0A556QPF3_9BACT|nr:ChbG/HpnK family deacetylase [Rariglobus hedericola]TSJ78528.1 ChbG/HpnK family deacetylase [Rariglobus hedericola]
MSTPPTKRLLIRLDDAGLNLDTNRGIEAAARTGPGRSVGIMACTPAFEDAARRLRNLPRLAIGVHLTLNSEWTNLRWGPVLPASDVPSLVDEEGFLPLNHQLYRNRPPVIAEVIAELRAQIAAVRAAGLKPCYADEHMVFASISPQLAQPIRELLSDEGLFYARDARLLTFKPEDRPAGSRMSAWCQALHAAAPGDYLLVTHPACAGEELAGLTLPGKPPGEAALSRIDEYTALSDPELAQGLTTADVRPITYRDLQQA